MNLIKIGMLTLIISILGNKLCAQNVKPQFKEFTLVAYRVNDSAKKLAATIDLYYHINSEGTLHIIMNGRTLNGGDDANYNGLLRDTTYKLSDNVINRLNAIFDGKRKLNSFLVRPMPINLKNLVGSGDYITYTDLNGVTDRLLFSQTLFGRDINSVLNLVIFSRLARTIHNAGIFHDRSLEAEILKYHLACKCLPVAKPDEPPPAKQLKLN